MAFVAIESINFEPIIGHWAHFVRSTSCYSVLGYDPDVIRTHTRKELGLPDKKTILATGHQPTLWHPGILAKYIAVDAVVRSEAGQRNQLSTLNVIVDQDAVACGAFDVPMKSSDGRWRARTIDFAPLVTDKDVPAGRQPAFEPVMPAIAAVDELPGLLDGVARMHAAMKSHASAPSAARQTAGALSQLMNELCGIDPIPTIMASELMNTTLAITLLEAMASDAHGCAEAYNSALAFFPDARVAPLQIRDDYVELPLWRIRDDGMPQRLRAYDADVERWLDERDSRTRPTLLPRALCMTALIRMGVADVFVHGRGGAIYDKVMEHWIKVWKPACLAPIVVASATMTLPLMQGDDVALVKRGGLKQAINEMRLLMHDPEAAATISAKRPGPHKRALLQAIATAPPHSRDRRAAYFTMHQQLDAMRRDREAAMRELNQRVSRMERLTEDGNVALRRDWAFPLYPTRMLAELVERIRAVA